MYLCEHVMVMLDVGFHVWVSSLTSRDSGEKWKIAKHCQLGIQHVHQILPKFRSPISYNYRIWGTTFSLLVHNIRMSDHVSEVAKRFWTALLLCYSSSMLNPQWGSKNVYSASTLGTHIVQIGNLKTDLLYCWLQCLILIGQKEWQTTLQLRNH